MNWLTRATRIIQSAVSETAQPSEEVRQSINPTTQQMYEGIATLREALQSTRMQRERLERRQSNLEDDVEHHNAQAREAMSLDRPDLSRRALAKKQSKMTLLTDLGTQLETLYEQEEALEEQLSKQRAATTDARLEQETATVQADAAESVAHLSDTSTSSTPNRVAAVISDVESQIDEMEARTQAIDELQSDAVFNSPLNSESLDSELDNLTTSREIEAELETLRENTE